MSLTDSQAAALELTARGLGNTVNKATRDDLDGLGLIAPAKHADEFPYWHLTREGWRALSGDDPAHEDDYDDQQADAWRDAR